MDEGMQNHLLLGHTSLPPHQNTKKVLFARNLYFKPGFGLPYLSQFKEWTPFQTDVEACNFVLETGGDRNIMVFPNEEMKIFG